MKDRVIGPNNPHPKLKVKITFIYAHNRLLLTTWEPSLNCCHGILFHRRVLLGAPAFFVGAPSNSGERAKMPFTLSYKTRIMTHMVIIHFFFSSSVLLLLPPPFSASSSQQGWCRLLFPICFSIFLCRFQD